MKDERKKKNVIYYCIFLKDIKTHSYTHTHTYTYLYECEYIMSKGFEQPYFPIEKIVVTKHMKDAQDTCHWKIK